MRGKRAPKRKIKLDPVYKNHLLARFINRVMKDGKKELARKIVYEVLERIGKETGEEPTKVFEDAIANVSPSLEVRPRRVGGASYQVPMEVKGNRRETLAIRWLIFYAKSREGKSMIEKLSSEIVDAYRGKGGAMKKKIDTHKMAEANKAFAHFRW